jgi:hypothetical protein
MVGTAQARLCPPYTLLINIVVARSEATKQSRLPLALDCFARNDGMRVRAKTNFAKLFKAIGPDRSLTQNISLSFFQKL